MDLDDHCGASHLSSASPTRLLRSLVSFGDLSVLGSTKVDDLDPRTFDGRVQSLFDTQWR